MKKPSKIKGLFTLDKLFIYDTIEVQKGLTMKYKYIEANGYWDNQTDKKFDVKIATESWNGNEDSDDEKIFYYLDKDETIKEGDIISDGFTITKIYGKD